MTVENMGDYNFYEVTRKELKNISNLKHGDVIKVSKYYIYIILKNYSFASMESYVNTFDSLNKLPIYKQPQYIRDFLSNVTTV